MLQIRDFTQPNKNNIEYVKLSNRLKTCNEDDILIGRYGASVGKILTGLAGAYNVAIVKVAFDQDAINSKFLLHYLNGKEFQHFILNVGSRAAQAGFNKSDLANLNIPLPPLTEQKRIAGILDAAYALGAKRRESIAQLDTLLQSTFLDMFGDPVTNPMRWKRRTLGEIRSSDTAAATRTWHRA